MSRFYRPGQSVAMLILLYDENVIDESAEDLGWTRPLGTGAVADSVAAL
jgi:hypothetical protein